VNSKTFFSIGIVVSDKSRRQLFSRSLIVVAMIVVVVVVFAVVFVDSHENAALFAAW
jgi:hypothetical protein